MSSARQASAEIDVPELDEDPAERKRLLNLLAQRRYRKRKRETIRELQSQVKNAARHGQVDSISEADVQGILGLDLTTDDAEVEDANNSTSDLPTTMDSLFDEMLANEHLDLALPEASPPILDRINLASAEQQDQAEVNVVMNSGRRIVNAFADYAISTPGLGVVRAKVEVGRHLHGESYRLDIWDPRTVSPLFHGHQPSMSVSAFSPTPMQKCVEHHPLLDTLPWSSFRDRYLYIMTLPIECRPKIAQQDRVAVTMELMMAVKDAGGGIRVWNANPFLPENWEIGPVFYSKFWWAIDADIVQNSNKHRALRGETLLRLTDIQLD